MLTDTEKMLMDCLMKHKVQEEAIKIIIMILLENTQGQNLLINFLKNNENLTEEEIVQKALEIKG